jgi:hypothetical protein
MAGSRLRANHDVSAISYVLVRRDIHGDVYAQREGPGDLATDGSGTRTSVDGARRPGPEAVVHTCESDHA